MASPILLTDTFKQWIEKFNELNEDFQDVIVAGDTAGFSYDSTGSSGLGARILTGKVRDGSLVETLSTTIVPLNPTDIQVVVIYKKTGFAPEFQVFSEVDLPDRFVIPIALFQTNATDIVAYTDLRTQFIASAGSGGGASNGMIIMDRTIESDVTISAAQGAISVSPIVNPGVTVTVEPGGEWVVL